MKIAVLLLALLFQAASLTPALAQGACPSPCPDGKVWSAEEGKCVVMRTLV